MVEKKKAQKKDLIQEIYDQLKAYEEGIEPQRGHEGCCAHCASGESETKHKKTHARTARSM